MICHHLVTVCAMDDESRRARGIFLVAMIMMDLLSVQLKDKVFRQYHSNTCVHNTRTNADFVLGKVVGKK